MLYAIDVSHHNSPASLDWAGMRAAGCDLCIVRLTYGTRKDRHAREHIARARAAGFVVGAYAFARPTERVLDQFVAFCEVAEEVGYGQAGDVIPALDIEDDTASRPIGPEHALFFEEYATLLKRWKSEGCYAYITQRDWGRLGRPAWVLDLPLFVAHYAAPSRKEPATPNGMPWCIWQHRVGPFEMLGPSGYDRERPLLDQSRVRHVHFFGGDNMVFDEPGDEELRTPPDTDGTADIRRERLDAEIRALATEAAITSGHDLIRDDRGRELMDTIDDTPESDVDPEGENRA